MAEILKINTPDEAKLAAENVVRRAQEQHENQKNVLKDVLEELKNVNPELGGFDEIATLLALSDEHFAVVAPIFLAELEKSFNNVNDQLAMVQAMNVAGVRAEDVTKEYVASCEHIDTQMGDVLSHPKRDFLLRILGMTYNAVTEANGIAKRNILIPIEYCHADAKMPAYAHLTDAGMDVYALEDITINPGETKLVKTGIKVALPYGYELQVRPKSGRALKTKMRVANSPGTIDSGYRDEIGVIIDNIEPPIKNITYEADMVDGKPEIRITSILHGSPMFIGKGEKFAQLVLKEQPKVIFTQVNSVSGIGEDRGGGFGSTGLK